MEIKAIDIYKEYEKRSRLIFLRDLNCIRRYVPLNKEEFQLCEEELISRHIQRTFLWASWDTRLHGKRKFKCKSKGKHD